MFELRDAYNQNAVIRFWVSVVVAATPSRTW